MKLKSVRQSVSQVFDVLIPEGKWNSYLEMLDKDGHPNRREMVELVLTFGKHIEALEDAVMDLSSSIEVLGGKNEAISTPAKEIKLRTVHDIQAELEASITPQTKVLYVSSDDWSILEKNVNPNDPETMPGKEYDPKDQKEKTALYYKDLLVFKQ